MSTSPADGLVRETIAAALELPPRQRADFLRLRLLEIQELMAQRPEERPWTFTELAGTDGSRIFRGGTGHSLVVDPEGTLWRARSYEDFLTEYTIDGNECTISSLTPVYREMRRHPLT